MICSDPGCDRAPAARGMCKAHYAAWFARDPSRPRCSVEGCGRAMVSRGFCRLHYRRWHLKGDPGPAELLNIVDPSRPCSVEGCQRPYNARGFCQQHYMAWRKWGDPLVVGERRTGCVICHHPDRARIERELAAGLPHSEVYFQADPSVRSVQLSAHARTCMDLAVRKRVCAICVDDRVDEIEAALSGPEKLTHIARRFSLPYHPLWRHSREHIDNEAQALAVAAFFIARASDVRRLLDSSSSGDA